MLSVFVVNPMITLKVPGKDVGFLCDSGACKTVFKTPVPNLQKSNAMIWVKSADGVTQTEAKLLNR